MTDHPALAFGRLGLGTAPLGGLYDAVEEETARAVVERAWELGIRYFDTAPYYGSGSAERRLGAVLCERPREEFVLSTKVGRLLRRGESDWRGAPPLQAYFDFSYDATLRSLAESLERLGLDRVDVALIHDPDDHYDEAIAGSYPALARLRDEGVVSAIGVGMNQTELLCRFALETDPDCFVVAGRYTLLDRSADERLLSLCGERGIAVVAAGVFNSGVLAGGSTYDYESASPAVLERVDELQEICARRRVPLAAAALQFPARHPAVASVLVGCRTPGEVEEDVRLFELDLTDELWGELV
ncbi:MAG: D-threo-aldose 1-dehydrogenase [Gaiellales bacterium]|nr:D-threo-aldose 1-dehydrogenase [Gaiellales bacterium]